MNLIKSLAISWAANAIILGVVVALPFASHDTAKDLLIAAALFGVLNTILKPILKLLTLPIAVITLGLIWFFVAMLMLWITSELVPDGLSIHGFWNYVWATVVVWVMNVVLDVVPGPWRGTR